ncbi:hypothetical protein [Clostridium botulinum]|uniref:hypothetical protein n=1 Tax=Clostridium botulinum TaxID=1491 RepID=UPI00249DD626|nr:hypothetical protein [Clostridium botulinum]MDU4596465.1 hypothetical protein [Clostridium sporogenes]WGZ48100.1 hypothetical protein HEQ52_18305 [Clostridium botulinum]
MPEFYGYTFLSDGTHTGKIAFDNGEIALIWLRTQSKLSFWKRVILTDTSDFCVAEIIDHKATFPPELVKSQVEGRF